MDAKRSKKPDVWRDRIVAQQASGRSVRGWCREHGYPEHGFYWWRARLGLSPSSAVKRRRSTAAVGFTQVVVAAPSASAEAMTLRLRGGRELLLPGSMPVAWLAELLHAIEGAS